MAILHRAEITPSKLELVQGWAPSQPWFAGDVDALAVVGAYRFDDPDGEVGIETLLVASPGSPVMQIPVTYRGAPLPGGEAHLIGTMEHTVLGSRWVYDGAGDPVALAAFATAARTGGRQAQLLVETENGRVTREPTALVEGSGAATEPVAAPQIETVALSQTDAATAVAARGLHLVLHRRPGASAVPVTGDGATADVITGTWAGQESPALLAEVAHF